jgi:hypothetical protein
MKVSPLSVSINGNPGAIVIPNEMKLVNMGPTILTGITYNILGLDSILYDIEVDHPSSLQPGKICIYFSQYNFLNT